MPQKNRPQFSDVPVQSASAAPTRARRTGQTVMITGATSGIGAEFARQLAGQGHDLVIVSRHRDQLAGKVQALEAQYGISVEAITADLSTPEGIQWAADRLSQDEQPISMLINNAGSGLATDFHESELQDELEMMRLLIEAPLTLSHAAIRAFLARGGGRILNVASVAGLIPDGSYGAAKAWAVSFSRWANVRYRGEGVTVTALCPGLVRTEFHQRAGIKTAGRPKWLWMDVDDVVREGLTAAAQGQGVCIPSRRIRSLMRASRFSPDSVLAWAARHEAKEPKDPQAPKGPQGVTGSRPGTDRSAEPSQSSLS